MFKKSILSLLLLSSVLYASGIEITNAYIRATPPRVPNSAAFLSIVNNSKEDITLDSITSNIVSNIEMHNSSMKNGVMSMKQVKNILIKANSSRTLKPGSLHIMLFGIKNKPLKAGDKHEFIFNFSNKEILTLDLSVKSVMQGMMHSKMKKMDHSKMPMKMQDETAMKHKKMIESK